jgi:Papain family cysteine protease
MQRHGPVILGLWIRMVAVLAAAFALAPASAQARPNYVNLAANQTPLKHQGSRGTCIVFASIAALEAAYNRAGYGQIDLSEQFLNHMGKMLWLKPEAVDQRGEDIGETQVGAFGGGGSIEYLEEMTKGIRVPDERAMPYVARNFTAQDHPHLANHWQSPFWTQRRTNDFNLDAVFLPRSALTQPLYYSVRRYAIVSATDADAIEEVLASGREVAWDFRVAIADRRAAIWTSCRADQTDCGRSAHAMLIIGYDRRDPDAAKHHFIVKNSWRPTRHPDGFTRISYEFLRKQGIRAGYIIEVEKPRPWPELAFIGRWNLSFDGHKGVLDIYHVPGVAQWLLDRKNIRLADRRIGTFYDESGKAYRVNGRISAGQIEFFLDHRNRNARWDQLGGRRFVYSRPIGAVMTGFHVDPDGSEYAGYATQAPLADGATTPRPFRAASFLGSWRATFLAEPRPVGLPEFATLVLDRLDSGFLSPAEQGRYDGIVGRLTLPGGEQRDAHVLVDRARASRMTLRIHGGEAGARTFEMSGYHLGHARGIAVGRGTEGADLGFMLIREPER